MAIKKKVVAKKRVARKKVAQKREIPAKPTTVFLPDCLDQVRAIAKRGLSDDEMAEVFGISKKLMRDWKKFYPDFAKTIEDGRTDADARVVRALYEKAIGYEHRDTKIFYNSRTEEVVEVDTVKHFAPDTSAINLWLTNRQKEHWANRQDHSVGGKADDLPIGIRNESKDELVASILSLIHPKADPI